MRQSLSLVAVLMIFSAFSVSGQDNFSVSIDVGESSNHSNGIFNDGNGLLVINNLSLCPPVGTVACSGYISYHYQDGFLHDTLFSDFPNGLNSTGKSNICKFGDKFLSADNFRMEGEGLIGVRIVEIDGRGNTKLFLDLMNPSVCDFGCYFRSILSDSLENTIFIMGQMSTEEGNRHPFLIKMDSTGDIKWTSIMDRHWSSGNVVDAQRNPDGDILIVSRDGSATHFIARVTKVSPDGEVLWDRHYDTGRVGAGQPWLAVMDDSTYVLKWAGDLGVFQIHYRYGPLFMWLDKDGEVLWETPQIKTREFLDVTRINPTSNGDIIGSGQVSLIFVEEWEDHPGDGGFLMRMSSTGEMLWNRRYLDLSNDADEHMRFEDVTELPDGSLVAVGSRRDTVGLGVRNVNAWVVRLDEDGYCNDPVACEHLIIIDQVVSVEELEEEPVSGELHIFPNPASHEVTVEGLTGGIGLLDVYSSNAELVYSRRVDGEQTTLQVSDWPSGMYIIMYRTSDGKEVKRGRLIVK
ncbi:MAG: T9SS C-terminal target domain-containing protein [Saprospirales bacterium]|nr:MAG: T9SS C-terminal target domain-containing protein [Saprospirales bacterium]